MRNTTETTAGNSKRTIGNRRDNIRGNSRTEPREAPVHIRNQQRQQQETTGNNRKTEEKATGKQ